MMLSLKFGSALRAGQKIILLHNFDRSGLRAISGLTEVLLNKMSGPKNIGNTLENMLGQLSGMIYEKNRVYKKALLKIINNIATNHYSTKNQGLLLIRCCSELLPDESAASRMMLIQQVWDTLKTHTDFTVDHYNELLRCYIDNQHTITAAEFIQEMSPVKPNELTFHLLLASACEAGNLDQASEIIANMKNRGFLLTQVIFNQLIVGHGKCGKLEDINPTIDMMNTVNIDLTADTYTALLRAYAWNARFDLMDLQLENCKKHNIHFTEKQIMDVVKTLALKGHDHYIPKVLNYLPPGIRKTAHISVLMQSISTQLIYLGCPQAAVYIYDCLPLPSFGPKDDIGLHGRSLIRECIKASIPNDVVLSIAKHLRMTGRNPIALESTCESALQMGKRLLAFDVMNEMKNVNLPIRPHYFWPIFVTVSKQFGEKHIFETISEMLAFEVEPDYETLLDFVMPFVSFASPDILVKKFQFVGIPASKVVTPILVMLLSSGQNRSAKELCEQYNVKVDIGKIINAMVTSYNVKQDINSILGILKMLIPRSKDENKTDWVGLLLVILTSNNNIKNNISKIQEIIKAFQGADLKISNDMFDSTILNVQQSNNIHKTEKLIQDIESLRDSSINNVDHVIPYAVHPRDMDTRKLKDHLLQLEAKNMNTRGVIRRLLMNYCKQGDIKNAKKIVTKCESEGIRLSSGMKAMIVDLNVKSDNLEGAESMLLQLQNENPDFLLDEHKILDIATLMALKGRKKQILEFLDKHSRGRKIHGGKGIEMNCWRLLNTVSESGNAKETEKILNLLTRLGYAQVSNRLLGPLIKAQINSKGIDVAVEEFTRCAEKYKKTPLKHEILCYLVKHCEGQVDDNCTSNEKYRNLLSQVFESDSKIHGKKNAQLSVVAALAEVGLKKALLKYLTSPNVYIHNEELLMRCERFASENKLNALKLIAECTRGLKNINREEIYSIILKIYELNNDGYGALQFHNELLGIEEELSEEFTINLASILKANKIGLPPNLEKVYDDETNKEASS